MSTPLIDVGHGWSSDPDAAIAGRQAAREALAGVRHHAPALVSVSASGYSDPAALLAAIRAGLDAPEVPLIGATAAGEYRNGRCPRGVQVTILASPHLRAHGSLGRHVAQDWARAVDTATGDGAIAPYFSNHPAHWRELTRRGSCVFGMVFSPAPSRHVPSRGFHILDALKTRSQWQIPFVGGAAEHVFVNDAVADDAVAVAVVETELRFGIGLSHGFCATAHELEVTAVDQSEIVSLDHRPALDVFAECTGHATEHLRHRHLTLSTGHGFGHTGSMGLLQLNAAAFATDRGGIGLTRPVTEGTRLRLLDVSRDHAHTDTAADAVRKAMMRAHHTRPAAAMMWYCAMRPTLLPAEVVDTELASAARMLGDAPLLGSFSHAQHGVTQEGDSTHYAGGVSVLLIGNELTPCALVARENAALQAELAAHSALLTRSHGELEQRVAQRTRDLKEANERLRTELRERHRYEAAELARAKLVVEEAALRDHLRLQETLFDAIPVPVFHKDVAGRYTGCNSAFAAFLGREKRDIIGRTVFEVAQGDLAQHYRDRDLDLLDDLIGTQVYESRITRVDGQVRQVVFHKARITTAEGRAMGIVGSILDITDLTAAAQAREGALEEAQRLAQLRKDFLSNMSHEIRSPLNVVLGLAEAGRRQNCGRKAEATFERILGAGQMLLALVNDILDFSKIESGKLRLADEAFVLGEVIDQAVTVVAQDAADKGLALSVEESADLPVRCQGDPLRLAQILVNLLSNAVKFTEHGAVRLRVRRDDGYLWLSVTDTGIGMTDEAQSRLFDAFEQAEASTTRRFGGTGLGLAITARLVELMHGEIVVSSTPGQGSRFDVCVPLLALEEAAPVTGRVATLGLPEDERKALADALRVRGVELMTPFAEDAPGASLLLVDARAHEHPLVIEAGAQGLRMALVCAPGAADLPARWPGSVLERPLRPRHVVDALQARHNSRPADACARRRLAGLRILAVEDAEMNRIVLEALLADEGAELTLVDSGLSAVEMVEQGGAHTFDIVLTDIQMPGIDGYETTHRLRALAPELPVIGLTAFALPEERAKCLAAGMADHVTKPIDLDRLVGVIRTQVNMPDSEPPFPHSAPSSSPTGPQDTPVNWAALNACFPDRPEVVTRLARSFVRSHDATLARLEQAIDACDLDALAQVAHSLKGTAGHLRAHALREAAHQAFTSANAGDGQAIDHARQLLDALALTVSDARRHAPD